MGVDGRTDGRTDDFVISWMHKQPNFLTNLVPGVPPLIRSMRNSVVVVHL